MRLLASVAAILAIFAATADAQTIDEGGCHLVPVFYCQLVPIGCGSPGADAVVGWKCA